MKKLLPLLTFCLIIGNVYGQLPNSSFESWNSTPYDEPTGWQTGNHESVSLGLIPVTKVAGTSGFAVRMQTTVSNGDTAQAYIANGDPGSGQGGIPFAQQPTAITGYYRYQLPANDTAILLVMFKSNGTIFSQNIFKIKGTGTQNTFAAFSFPLSVGIMPDSVIFAAASSNLIDNVGVENGSFLELDGIAFTGSNTPINNGTFENWTTFSNDAINGWETYGDGVSRTSDSYDGSFAISLETVDYGNGYISNSGMTSGHNTQNGPIGGTPYTETVDTLIGYYQYFATGPDSASVNISLLNNSNYISGIQKLLPPTSQYTYFEVPIYANSIPDTMRVDFSSSKWPTSPSSIGSRLILDHLQLKSVITAGIENPNSSFKNLSFAFPNPANNMLHIRLANDVSENVLIEVYDLAGRLMIKDKKNVNDRNIDLSITSLTPGKYFYKVYCNGRSYQQTFSKE